MGRMWLVCFREEVRIVLGLPFVEIKWQQELVTWSGEETEP